MVSMTSCWACETELRPEWKFCIQCGVPVEGESAAVTKKREVGPLAVFGWIFAGLGAALLIGGIILFLVVR